jgi:hypothetical protein
MCPICISVAAWAAMAGTGSAAGLVSLAAVKLGLRLRPDMRRAATSPTRKRDLQPDQSGGGQ